MAGLGALATAATVGTHRPGPGGGGRTIDWEYPEARLRPEIPVTPRWLFIGPAGFAGQGFAWARAVEHDIPDVGAI